MKKETARALMIIVGVFVLLVILGLGSAVWLFTSTVDIGEADEASAVREFERIRARFAGVQPVIVVEDGEPTVARRPAEGTPRADLSTLRIVAWDPDDRTLARIDIPFWLLRLKSGPIEIGTSHPPFGNGNLGITVEELEQLGATLVLDHEDRDGDRVLAWTQ